MFGLLPEDELTLLQAPALVVVQTVAGSTVPLIGSDPTRVILIISAQEGQPIWVAPGSLAAAQTGRLIAGAQSVPLQLTWGDYGALVGQSWSMWSSAPGIKVTALTVSMGIHPAVSGFPNLFPQRTSPAAYPVPVPVSSVPAPGRPLRMPAGFLSILRGRCPRVFGEG